jgi:hypothetical protein
MLPKWLAYLAAAPLAAEKGKITKRTYYILDENFEQVDQGLMLKVAQEFVRRSKWFPSVQELLAILEELEAAAAEEDEQWLIAWDTYAVLQFKRAAATWPVCPNCEERTPSLADCPFCTDMAAMAAEYSAAEPDYEPVGEMIDVTGREYAAVITTG